jgi:hypothetical protein
MFFPEGKVVGNEVTAHLYQVPKLRMGGDIPSLPNMSS